MSNGERVSELRPVSDHVPEHRTVLDLDPPVAGLEVRPRVRADVAHEAVDAGELALHLAHRVLASGDPIEWERPAPLVDECTDVHWHVPSRPKRARHNVRAEPLGRARISEIRAVR